MTSAEPHSPSPQRYVSTAQVAKALGIGVTTVKRWVDEGILTAQRTAGGHRKLLMSDVLRLAREGNLPQADLSRLVSKPLEGDLTDPAHLRQLLQQALHAGDASQVRLVVHGAYNSGYSIGHLTDRVICPAMREIGEQWSTGEIQILDEHLATQALVSALYELKASISVNGENFRPVAIGGAPEHDHYVMSSLLAQMILTEEGWNPINLGPHTPFCAFLNALREFKPRLAWVTVSHLVDPEKFVREYTSFFKACEAEGTAVAVGGRGLPEAVRDRIPYSVTGPDLDRLAEFARTLHVQPGMPRRGRPPLDAESSVQP